MCNTMRDAVMPCATQGWAWHPSIELHVISNETIGLLGHHSMVDVVALDAVRREQEVPTHSRNMFWYGDTTGHLKDNK